MAFVPATFLKSIDITCTYALRARKGDKYIKFDASLVRNIDSNETNKSLLRGLCLVAHSIGIFTIAEGVNTHSEITALQEIGMDGVTGPGVQLGGSKKS